MAKTRPWHSKALWDRNVQNSDPSSDKTCCQEVGSNRPASASVDSTPTDTARATALTTADPHPKLDG
jgi:hypothetical protein